MNHRLNSIKKGVRLARCPCAGMQGVWLVGIVWRSTYFCLAIVAVGCGTEGSYSTPTESQRVSRTWMPRRMDHWAEA